MWLMYIERRGRIHTTKVPLLYEFASLEMPVAPKTMTGKLN